MKKKSHSYFWLLHLLSVLSIIFRIEILTVMQDTKQTTMMLIPVRFFFKQGFFLRMERGVCLGTFTFITNNFKGVNHSKFILAQTILFLSILYYILRI